jgi:hypothetical protein
LSGAVKHVSRASAWREPLEIARAIVDTIAREVQPGGRGTQVFPFNTIHVSVLATSSDDRARLEAMFDGDHSLASRVAERLRGERCDVGGLDVHVAYLPRAQKNWRDPQFTVAFSRTARPPVAAVPTPVAVPIRIDITVLRGVADRRSYSFQSARIELGRGAEVRDSRHNLIRTNHVAFAEVADDVNRSVSRQHAHIAYDSRARTFRLHDDGSVHGSGIVRDGKAVAVPAGTRGVRLRPRDEIVLGDAKIVVKFEP